MKRELCQVLVELRGVRPLIWRRLLVPSDMNLTQLHQVLQCAMGWKNKHSYTFESATSVPLSLSWPNESVGKVFSAIEGTLIYLYDPGDGWEHEVTLDERLPCDADRDHAVCLAGERACPPEDCGGVPGYADVLKAIQKTNDKRYSELREWTGMTFDPLAFSVDEVNRSLARLSRHRKLR